MKQQCPKDSAHSVIMARSAGSVRQYWYCMWCKTDIGAVADDHSFTLSQRLYELAGKLEEGEIKVTRYEERCDSTVLITHVTYIVAGGIDRIELKFRDPSKEKPEHSSE